MAQPGNEPSWPRPQKTVQLLMVSSGAFQGGSSFLVLRDRSQREAAMCPIPGADALHAQGEPGLSALREEVATGSPDRSGVSLWRSAGRVVPGSGTPGAEVCWRDSTQLKCSLAGRKNSRMEEGRAGTGASLLNCGQREPGRVSTREIALSLPLGAG